MRVGPRVPGHRLVPELVVEAVVGVLGDDDGRVDQDADRDRDARLGT